MGWCSGTEIFDAVVDHMMEEGHCLDREVLVVLVDALEGQDWDCQSDSKYWSNPYIQTVFNKQK